AAQVDTAADEVAGWTELFATEHYDAAAKSFQKCSDKVSGLKLRDMTAFFKWCQAKAMFLAGVQGSASARPKALELINEAIETCWVIEQNGQSMELAPTDAGERRLLTLRN